MTYIPFAIQVPVGVSMEGAFSQDIIQMIIYAGPTVKLVLFVLLMFSFISWTIVFAKFRLFRRAKQETISFLELFWEGGELTAAFRESRGLKFSPVASLFKAGYSELLRIQKKDLPAESQEDKKTTVIDESHFRLHQATMESLERVLKKGSIDQMNRMERALGFLATTGNTAPFIGLFGTVWGIMDAFRGIGVKGSANLAVVAPGISEALVATAAGLAAAIPAVVAYNYFAHRLSGFKAEMDIFTSDFLGIAERQLLRL